MSLDYESEVDDRDGLFPVNPCAEVISFWNELRIDGNPGATVWAVLDRIEQEVADAMWQDPPDVDRAVYLTFKAVHAINGDI